MRWKQLKRYKTGKVSEEDKKEGMSCHLRPQNKKHNI
jgi:hypothetical protein